MVLSALRNLFQPHHLTQDQILKAQEIRDSGYELAETISMNCPTAPEREIALQKVREAVMWANAAIACTGETR